MSRQVRVQLWDVDMIHLPGTAWHCLWDKGSAGSGGNEMTGSGEMACLEAYGSPSLALQKEEMTLVLWSLCPVSSDASR